MASQPRPSLGAYGLTFAGIFLLWRARRRGGRIWAVLICAFAFATLGVSGCSSGGSISAPPAQTAPGTYHFNVTASSGTVESQSAYILVVK